MSQLKVNTIVDLAGTGAPELTEGATLPSGKTISGSGGLNLTGSSSVGVLTATSITADSINVISSGNLNVTGVVTASGGFSGDGSAITNLPSAGAYYFNTGISSAVGYALTTGFYPAYSAGVTTTSSYLVQSIQVSNITGTANCTVDARMYANDILIADNIPVPPGATVELLRKPKILVTGQDLEIRSNTSNDLHATIAVEEVLSNTTFVGAGITVSSSNTYVDLYSNASNYMVESILLTNIDSAADVKATVVWTNGSNTIQGYYVYDMIVPYAATVEILDRPKFVPAGFKVRVSARDANRLNATIAARTLA